MNYYLKTDRGADAETIEEKTATNILKRLRHRGRKMTEIYVLEEDGGIDRYQERTRRRLGSNAIASRTWLCESLATATGKTAATSRNPRNRSTRWTSPAVAVVLVLQGAEAPEEIVPQLGQGMAIAK
ncbi:MAG: hypothetical protein R2849_17290 [Thermomicrobiales bacterium]